MSEQEWNVWFQKVKSHLSERQLWEPDQSEEFEDAINRNDYWLAEQIIFELIKRTKDQ